MKGTKALKMISSTSQHHNYIIDKENCHKSDLEDRIAQKMPECSIGGNDIVCNNLVNEGDNSRPHDNCGCNFSSLSTTNNILCANA